MGAIQFDSKISWAIAAACACMNFLIMLPTKVSGLFFVEILDRYKVSRSVAAYPSFTLTLMRCSFGPIIGYLAERFGLNKVMVAGSVLSSVGIAGCFFAEDIATVTLFLGIIHGCGIGFNNSLLPQIMKAHFKKYITMAFGLTQAGSCFGAFFTPPLLLWIFRIYGTSGGFLIIGAIVFNSLPIVLWLNILSSSKYHSSNPKESSAEQLQKCTPTIPTSTEIENIIPDYKIDGVDANIDGGAKWKEKISESQIQHEIETVNTVDMADTEYGHSGIHVGKPSHSESHTYSASKCETIAGLNIKDNKNFTKVNLTDCNSRKAKESDVLPCTLISFSKVPHSRYLADSQKFQGQTVTLIDESVSNPCTLNATTLESLKPNNQELQQIQTAGKQTTSESKNIKSKLAKRSLNIFLDLTFWMIIITQSVFVFVIVLFWTTMIDFSRDKNIDKSKEVYLLITLPISEIIGRIGMGWITDGNYLTRINFCFVSFIAMGFSCSLMAWGQEFYLVTISIFVFGIITGGLTSVFPMVVFEFFESDMHTMAQASRYLLFGPLSFLSGPLIGHFRGTFGSYAWLYHTMALMSVACGALSELIPLLARMRDERQETSKILKFLKIDFKNKQ